MLTQEQFNKIESEHGCGYWNLCWEHACPCAITTENKGLTESIYNSFIEENKRIAEEYDAFDYDDMIHYERCKECGNLQEDNDLIDGLCYSCYDDLREEMEEKYEND